MDGIRIVEIPSCKMATSGCGSLDSPQIRKFDEWFSKLPTTLSPQDFMYYDPVKKGMVWLYAITAPGLDTEDFAVIDFTGGMYAAAISIDEDDADGERVYNGIKEWIEGSGAFELDEKDGRYCMFHIPTPPQAQKALGYSQLDIFVPIRLKQEG